MNTRSIIVIGASFLFICVTTMAQVPQVISYQGIATDLNGNPKTDGTYNFVFSLYDASSGGSLKWTESQALALSGGLFTAELGSQNPFNSINLFHIPLWLQIQIDNEPPLSPRVRLTTSPFSFKAVNADTADYLRNGITIPRPLNPKISHNEIKEQTVVRHLITYPVTGSDSIYINSDSVFLIGGRGIRLVQIGDSIKINNTAVDSVGGNTLDQAYNQGVNPGDGRVINANNGPVSIEGINGLQVTGVDNVITAYTDSNVYAGRFENTGKNGVALKAEITSDKNPRHAFMAISNGTNASASIHSIVTTSGFGRAGVFEILNNANKNEVINARNDGFGPAIYARTKLIPGGIPDTAAVIALSKNRKAIYAESDTLDGVFGTMNTTGNYNKGPDKIVAGVHGVAASIGGTADNFGVAGIGSGYGTGVLGIGSGAGYGVFAVSGTSSTFTSAGLRAITKEDSTGTASWPPFFPLDETVPYNKQRVGILGQAVKKVAIWGESIEKIGMVGTVGKRVGINDITGVVSGLAGMAFDVDAPGVYAMSEKGTAGFFKTPVSTTNTKATLLIENYGMGRSMEVLNRTLSSSATAFYTAQLGKGRAAEISIFNNTNSDVASYVYTTGLGRAGEFRIDFPQNQSVGLYGSTAGTGRAAEFNILNSQSSSIALFVSTNGNGTGIYAKALSTGNAGIFYGNVHVSGNLSKSGGQFHIDHPLDPENKYLNHSFVESPDMKNIYDGTILLDHNGEAIVILPDWFEALNMEFRYQLTSIGQPAPNLHVSKEVSDNQFKIAGGAAGSKVSWQLTGVRQDPYALQNRIVVEEEKSESDKGKYLHPELYGQSATSAIHYKKSSDAAEISK